MVLTLVTLLQRQPALLDQRRLDQKTSQTGNLGLLLACHLCSLASWSHWGARML